MGVLGYSRGKSQSAAPAETKNRPVATSATSATFATPAGENKNAPLATFATSATFRPIHPEKSQLSQKSQPSRFENRHANGSTSADDNNSNPSLDRFGNSGGGDTLSITAESRVFENVTPATSATSATFQPKMVEKSQLSQKSQPSHFENQLSSPDSPSTTDPAGAAWHGWKPKKMAYDREALQREADRRNIIAVRSGITDRFCRCGSVADCEWPVDGKRLWECDPCHERGLA